MASEYTSTRWAHGLFKGIYFLHMSTAEEKKKNPLVSYVESSYQELRKVAWPTRNQAIRLTFLVLGFMAVVAILIGLLDYVFGTGHRALLNLAPQRALPVIENVQPEGVPSEGEHVQPEGEHVPSEGVQPEGVPENAIDVGSVTVGEESTPS